MIDWNPLVAAGTDWLSWPPWKWLVFGLIVWHGMLGRATATRWVESLGWDGLRELLAGFGNSPSSMLRAQREAAAPTTNNVADLRRS